MKPPIGAAIILTLVLLVILQSDGPTVQPRGISDSLAVSDSLISIAAVGDIMMGSTYPAGSMLPPDDGVSMFAEVDSILKSADIAFGNLEGPLIDGGATTKCGPKSTDCYAFRMPSRYGALLRSAEFDLFSIANNHAMDFGVAGRASTMRTLDSVGIRHSGAPGTVAEFECKQRRIGFIAFSYDDDSNTINRLSDASIRIADLAARTDIVIVSFHGGAEGASKQRVPEGHERFLGEDRGDVRGFAHAAIDAGADLVLGHGPHVVRALELYNDRLIAYSLGNFATYQHFTLSGPNGISLILDVRLRADGVFHSATIHPTMQIKPGGPRIDTSRAVIPMLDRLTQKDFPNNKLTISATGVVSKNALD